MGTVEKASSNNFVRIKDASQFNEDSIENYNEESDKGFFLKLKLNI